MALPALLFDLDGTLVDTAVGIAAALSVVSARRGGPAVSVGTVRPLVSLGAPTLVAGALGDLAGDSAADIAEFRACLVAHPADPAAIFPGVQAALAQLAADGHAMAVVTNKLEHLAVRLLEEIGLAGHFGAIVGGDTLPVGKPDPAPLRHALALIGQDGRPAVMIGDSVIDARAAAAADVPFVVFTAGYGAEELGDAPVAGRYDGYDQLPALLARMGAAPARRPA